MIFFILLLSFLLRIIFLNQSLWLDEAVQAVTSQRSFRYIFTEIIGDFHPPLNHFLMYFWTRIFGYSEIVLRMPSVIFGVGTVGMAYLISKQLKLGKNLSICVSTFLATAPFLIYYSQEARMYSMVTFFIAGSFYFLLKVFKNGADGKSNWENKGLFFLFTLLALYTDYYAWLVFLAQAIFLLTQKKYKFLILNSFFLILCYLPWLPMVYAQIKNGLLATKLLPGWSELTNLSFVKSIPLTFIKFSIGRISIYNKNIYGLVAGTLGIIYGYFIFLGIKKKNLIFILWLFVPLFVAWITSLVIPNFQPFRLLLILPAFYFLLTIGIFNLNNDTLRYCAILFILVVNCVSSCVYFIDFSFHREDWRGLSRYLEEQGKVPVILPSETSNWPILYYDHDNKIYLIYGKGSIGTVGDLNRFSILKDEREVFYIRYLVPVFDPDEKIADKLKELGYSKIKEISFNQIPVWEYLKK